MVEDVSDDDSSDDEDGYDTDATNPMPKMVQKDYDTSDDEDEDEDDEDDVNSREEEVEEEIEVEADSGELPQLPTLGRGQRVRKQRSRYVPHTSEFTNSNVSNVRSNVGHFQGVGVLNLAYQGQKYHLRQGVVNVNLDENQGVSSSIHPITLKRIRKNCADSETHLKIAPVNPT